MLLQEVQGNILQGYGNRYRVVCHLALAVADAAAARAALARMVDGDRGTPDVTPGDQSPRPAGYRWCLNVGFTYPGLVALGVPAASLATFPPEFVQGMAARAVRLGDTGASAPERWLAGLNRPEWVHLIVTIHGWSRGDIAPIAGAVAGAEGGRAFRAAAQPLDGEVLFDETGLRQVHFGYADGISQPRFAGVHDPENYTDPLPLLPLGVVLLGHPTATPQVRWPVPSPEVLGRNGAFNAFRVLEQDVAGFEEFLTSIVATHGASGVDRELAAAKVCGRWRNGAPLVLAPDAVTAAQFDATRLRCGRPGSGELNDFDYLDDPAGLACPIGSHIRRVNPRSGLIVQRPANRTRALIRRGIPYGPPWDPDDPDPFTPRGLLGNFICASLSAQFEAIQYDWINLGFQDPEITGTNDPMVGANDPVTSTFSWPRAGMDSVVVRGFGRFVTTRGGAYTFLPSIPAIRWIAGLKGP